MIKKYNHKAVEKKWQKYWEDNKIWQTDENASGDKFYILDMFPYPSAEGLHVGHPEGYTASDIVARYQVMKGKKVLHPMGFDSFGLPAENYAIKTGTHPAKTTAKNIKNMRRQIKSLGFAYDWDREVITSDSSYYKWTQWIFIQLFKHGLAYEAKAPINWCLSCKTGLANEEVINGKCERCSTEVTKKFIKQWLVKITDEKYIERLLNDLDRNDLNWPESIKSLQRNWIGKSEGAEVDFKVEGYDDKLNFVLMHGFGLKCGADKMSFPWMKKNLEDRGYSVYVPELPNKENPLVKEWVDFVKDNYEFNENTVLAGESLSSSVALKIVEQLKRPIKKLVLTGAFIQPVNKDREYNKSFDWKFDFEKIKKNVGEIIVLADKNDSNVPFEITKEVADKTGGKLEIVIASKPHFRGEEEPAKLTACLPSNKKISVFTTRPDTLFGATYLVLSPEHELVDQITTEDQHQEVHNYQKQTAAKSDLERTDLAKDKTGVFTGTYAINPVNKKKIPVWIADYVLSSYGTGAIMAVPAHDERDYEFATKFKLPIIEVVSPLPTGARGDCYAGEGVVINSGDFNGLITNDFKNKIVKWLEQNKVGKKAVNYKLRDWLFSRQRYWGEPIPIVHCNDCKEKIESEAIELHFYDQSSWDDILSGKKTTETRALNPDESDRYFGDIKTGQYLKLKNMMSGDIRYAEVMADKIYSDIDKFYSDKKMFTGMGTGNAYKSGKDLLQAYAFTSDYIERIRKNGLVAWKIRLVSPGDVAIPEEDLPVELPNVKKYEPTGTGESPLASIDKWVNTKCPECGGDAKRETNTMPQWAGSNWYFLRYCDPHNNQMLADPEKLKAWLPVDLYIGGAEHAVLHLLYARFIYKFLFDIGVVPKEIGDEPFKKLKNQGIIMGEDGVKMSKSRGNVINPDDVIKEYGADTLRMYEMFMGPFEDSKPWDTKGIVGIKRFLDRVWDLCMHKGLEIKSGKEESEISKKLEIELHKAIKKVSGDIENFRFNTAISELMIVSKIAWSDKVMFSDKRKEILLKLLSPFAPHLCEELWEVLGHKESIAYEPWPEYDPEKLKMTEVVYVVQVNGKRRDEFKIQDTATEKMVITQAKASYKVSKYLTSEPKKIIFVPGKLINFVV